MKAGRAAACAAALLPLLGGCVAVVALPAVLGTGLMVRSDHRVRAATKVPRGQPTVELKTEQARAATSSSSASAITLTKLTELPAPSDLAAPAASAPWTPFFAYALAEAQAKPPQSALLAPGPRTDVAVRRACPSATPAVIVDLDDGAEPFAPQLAAPPAPALVDGLAKLREAGVVVLWITKLPAARAPEVAQWVRGSGLDPKGEDQFLLVRNADDRKQALREQANLDVCVVAIAGTTKDAFDELFDYLRDPALALGLHPMMGKGWFLVPPLSPAPAIAAPAPAAAPVPSASPTPAP